MTTPLLLWGVQMNSELGAGEISGRAALDDVPDDPKVAEVTRRFVAMVGIFELRARAMSWNDGEQDDHDCVVVAWAGYSRFINIVFDGIPQLCTVKCRSTKSYGDLGRLCFRVVKLPPHCLPYDRRCLFSRHIEGSGGIRQPISGSGRLVESPRW